MYRLPLLLVIAGLGRRRRSAAPKPDALALLDFVGLADQARTRAQDLPDGAQRFLELARARAGGPALLILDEPAAGLKATRTCSGSSASSRAPRAGAASPLLLIEHHMDVVSDLCDQVTVMDGGRVLAVGAPAAVKRHPLVLGGLPGRCR